MTFMCRLCILEMIASLMQFHEKDIFITQENQNKSDIYNLSEAINILVFRITHLV